MNEQTLTEIVDEIAPILSGRFLGKIFQLSNYSFALDFGLRDGGYLFLSAEPSSPRLYLIKRKVKDLEKLSRPHAPFAQTLRSLLGGGELLSIKKESNERLVRLSFSVDDEIGKNHERALIAQLTGRSANLFLLDREGVITHVLRRQGASPLSGEAYSAPTTISRGRTKSELIERGSFATFSDAADDYYRGLEAEKTFENVAAEVQAKVRKEIQKQKRLRTNLKKDLASHGNPEEHKQLGDLILANLSTAARTGKKVTISNYYAEGSPRIDLEIDENVSLQDAANEYFQRFTKAKRAIEEIGSRLVQIERQLDELETKQARIEEAVASRDEAAIQRLAELKTDLTATPGTRKKKAPSIPGTRRYRSSDGYEILVGRAAKDNDYLTFRVAKPNDLWLHAGDYPGSHVVVRNSSRKEIPHRTVVEAAQLAAKFSQASKDAKVTIHYTARKYLSKPKGAAPGLVRLSSFKTINVEPMENVERLP